MKVKEKQVLRKGNKKQKNGFDRTRTLKSQKFHCHLAITPRKHHFYEKRIAEMKSARPETFGCTL